jgi:hypothetical protein
VRRPAFVSGNQALAMLGMTAVPAVRLAVMLAVSRLPRSNTSPEIVRKDLGSIPPFT